MEKEKKEFNFSWYIVLLILILIFAFTVRFYFFSDYKNQPIWWDESEHVLMAKHIAFGTPDTGYNASREIFVPLIFAFIFKIFNSELAVRFFQLLFSVGIVWLTYLVGKEIFNKKTGLIAAFIMAVFHLNLFFTLRFGLEIIAPFFALLTVYFFWKGYVKKENQKVFIPLMAVFAAFAFMSSAKIAFLLISMFLFLLITERFTFFKNKKLWFALIIFLILLTPYMLYYKNVTGSFLPRGPAVESAVGENIAKNAWNWNEFLWYSKYFVTLLQVPFLLIFLIGIIYYFMNLVLGFDFLISNESKENSKYLFIILWILLPLLAFSYYMAISGGGYGEPRFLLEVAPAIFFIAANGLSKVSDWFKSYKKEIGFILVILILLTGAFYQLRFTDLSIKDKATSYLQVKQGAVWIKENSQDNDWIISSSAPQTTYYAERKTIGPPGTEEEYLQTIKELKPKFMVISVFEQQPQWYLEFPQKYPSNIKIVQAYTTQQNGQIQPLLIVYEFTNHNF